MMTRVLWLGGGPDSGKSTVARILSRQYGLSIYSLDKRARVHLEQLATGSDAWPAYRKVLNTPPAKRLVELPPEGHLAWSLDFARDRFPLLLNDLQQINEGPGPILVEGASLLPALIKPLLVSIRQAIWLIPTEAFIVANWERSKKRFMVRQEADQAQAQRDLVAFDRLLAEYLAADARAYDLRVLIVDGSRSAVEVARQVGKQFEPYLPAAG